MNVIQSVMIASVFFGIGYYLSRRLKINLYEIHEMQASMDSNPVHFSESPKGIVLYASIGFHTIFSFFVGAVSLTVLLKNQAPAEILLIYGISFVIAVLFTWHFFKWFYFSIVAMMKLGVEAIFDLMKSSGK